MLFFITKCLSFAGKTFNRMIIEPLNTDLDVEYCNKTLTSIYKGNRAQYTSQVLVDFMEDLIELYIDAFI